MFLSPLSPAPLFRCHFFLPIYLCPSVSLFATVSLICLFCPFLLPVFSRLPLYFPWLPVPISCFINFFSAFSFYLPCLPIFIASIFCLRFVFSALPLCLSCLPHFAFASLSLLLFAHFCTTCAFSLFSPLQLPPLFSSLPPCALTTIFRPSRLSRFLPPAWPTAPCSPPPLSTDLMAAAPKASPSAPLPRQEPCTSQPFTLSTPDAARCAAASPHH